MYCLSCGRHTKWLKTGKTAKVENETVRIWKCGSCGKPQNGYVSHKRQAPRELYFDIETSYITVVVHQLRVMGGYIPPSAILRPKIIICWTAGWVGENELHSAVVTPAQAKKDDDSKILKPLWDLMNVADVVIGHNSDNFDVKTFNYRLWVNGFEPPLKFRMVDTLKISKKYFRAESNKMDYLNSRKTGIKKNKMESQDWIGCGNGDQSSLDKMMRYNKNDVKEGKQLYEKLLSWIPVQSGQTVKQEVIR
jgi:hypothetical protein